MFQIFLLENVSKVNSLQEGQLMELQTERKSIELRLNQVIAQNQKAESSQGEANSLKSSLHSLQSRLEEITKQYTTSLASENELKLKMVELGNEKKEQNWKIGEWNFWNQIANNTRKKQNCESFKIANQSLKEERDQLKNSITETEKKIHEMKHNNQIIAEKESLLQQKMIQLTESLSTLDQKNQVLETREREALKNIDQLNGEIRIFQVSGSFNSNKEQELAKSIQQLNQEREIEKSKRDKLELKLKQIESESQLIDDTKKKNWKMIR